MATLEQNENVRTQEPIASSHDAPAIVSRDPGATVQPLILDEFARDLDATGVVGEKRAAKLLFLAITSRVMDRPVCVVVKGPSSGGKSHLVNKVLGFAPLEAFQTLTAMSERALIYSTEDLSHKMLVIQEAAGLTGKVGAYIVRSLISEGRVEYMVTERNPDTGRFEARPITREGPTGLILTTTRIKIDPETETRLLSISIDDTAEQTRAVLDKIGAIRVDAPSVNDMQRWHDLQRQIAGLPQHVVIPFAQTLAGLVPPVALRLKRDIGHLMTLIAAHALLNHATRARDEEGHVIATMEDYEAVYDLVNDLFSEGVALTVKPPVRATVEAVARLLGNREDRECQHVSTNDVAKALGLHKSAASRRVADAIEEGYLINDEESPGRPSKLHLGDPMPEDRGVLPSPDDLKSAISAAN